jgi:hypothetical protein
MTSLEMTSRHLLCVLFAFAVACSKSGRSDAQASASAAPTQSAAAAASSPPPAPPAPTAAEGPPKVSVNADGISLTETAGGAVVVKTTTLWNAPLEVTYENCDYYLRAIPVMERQVAPERGGHFKEVCKGHKVEEQKVDLRPKLKGAAH